MDTYDIIQTFGNLDSNQNPYKRMTQKELKSIFEFVKEEFRNNAHWISKNFHKFCKVNDFIPQYAILNLRKFANQYEKRKNVELKTLNAYIVRLDRLSPKHYYTILSPKHSYPQSAVERTGLSLNEDVDLDAFFKSIDNLKTHIKGSNKKLLYALNFIIHTGFTNKTLVKYYYNSK